MKPASSRAIAAVITVGGFPARDRPGGSIGFATNFFYGILGGIRKPPEGGKFVDKISPRRLASSLFAAFFASAATPADAAPTAIWLGGEDPVVQQDKHKGEPADYMDLFTPTAPWTTVASKLTAFKISMQFVLRGTDQQLRTVIDDLKRRHIGIAIELGVLQGSGQPGSCGYHVEGYASPASVEAVAKHIKNAGGQIEFVAMDEPVWYGHIFQSGGGGRIGCRDAIPALADQVALKIAVLRRHFPNIQVGDVEPINATNPQSIADIIAFSDALTEKAGRKLAFVHADVAWQTNWRPMLTQLASQLHRRNIPFGVICDGDANAGGNEAWVSQALRRCKDVAANPKTTPDALIAQSWEPLPSKMLPETDPGSLTYEARQFITISR
jgi:hypothetical protein